MIPFNKPYLSGKELTYIEEAVKSGKISGNGIFTKRCHEFIQGRYGFKKCLLATSGTAALEMAAILCDLRQGDEVIMPSYTFVSTANAFVLRGAKIVFADSRTDFPGIDEKGIETRISKRTKVIVVVHYAGIACDMDMIMEMAGKYNLLVVEDTAQSIDAYYKGKPLGGIGHFGCFSFHETKNIQCGEGGMLTVNDDRFIKRAEIIWEKGTNRVDFFRGNIDRYKWVDIGSSFLPSEITAAFLYAQFENIDAIQTRRKKIWEKYYSGLLPLEKSGMIKLPELPSYASNNYHIFYILCSDPEQRDPLIAFLKEHNIWSVFHYLSLHRSPFYRMVTNTGDDLELSLSEIYERNLLRLPLYYELSLKDVDYIIKTIKKHFKQVKGFLHNRK
jgi:dTDP-4-amino-4,6-dideoxygalactose transaminase